MPRRQTKVSRRSSYLRLIFITVAAIFILAFPRQMLHLVWMLLGGFLLFFGIDINAFNPETVRSLGTISFNCFLGFGLMFFLWIGLVSTSSVLPVSSVKEWYRTCFHLFLYILGKHGRVIFVKDGRLVFSAESLSYLGPGVIMVDYNSAVVLEELISPPTVLSPIKKAVLCLLVLLGLSDARETPRVRRSGLVFTRRRERILGVVDLRPQFAVQPGVKAYSREGIELSTAVFARFSVGQPPETLLVAFQGHPAARNLRVICLKKLENGRYKTGAFSDELDEPDQREIYPLALTLIRTQDPQVLPETPLNQDERIFAAVGCQALNSDRDVVPWQDLPVKVAVDTFREILSQTCYDRLYQPNDQQRIQLFDVKNQMRLRMRNAGMLAYQIVISKGKGSLEENREYSENELVISQVQLLTNSKVLRDRGISVLASGFGDLIPPAPVYQQRLQSWRAPWQRDTEIIRANHDLEAMRIRSQARSQAQAKLNGAFRRILNLKNLSEEAMALRIFQSLESLAADPKTRSFLPADTISLMQNVHAWLLPGESPPLQVRISPPQNRPAEGGEQ